VPSTASALAPGDSDASDDEDEEDGAHAWDDSSTRRHRRGGAGGVAVCQIIRNGLRFMAPVTRDGEFCLLLIEPKRERAADPVRPAVDPVVPLTFLADLYHVLETYISGPVTEATIKVSRSASSGGASGVD
jgi:AP-3 complex subunit mu